MIGAHKVRIANHIADFQPMFRCEFSVPHAEAVRTRDEGLRACFAMFREQKVSEEPRTPVALLLRGAAHMLNIESHRLAKAQKNREGTVGTNL